MCHVCPRFTDHCCLKFQFNMLLLLWLDVDGITSHCVITRYGEMELTILLTYVFISDTNTK